MSKVERLPFLLTDPPTKNYRPLRRVGDRFLLALPAWSKSRMRKKKLSLCW